MKNFLVIGILAAVLANGALAVRDSNGIALLQEEKAANELRMNLYGTTNKNTIMEMEVLGDEDNYDVD